MSDPALNERYRRVAELAALRAVKDGITDDEALTEIAKKAVDAQLELDLQHYLDSVEGDIATIDADFARATTAQSSESAELTAARAVLQQAA
jgi:hypothetical protein